MFSHAIVRLPGDNFAQGLTRMDQAPPVLSLALQQHAAYCDALRRCGLDLTVLPADPAYPDGTFVEDTAVLLPGAAIFTRPGARSRVGEVESMRRTAAPRFSSVADIIEPGTLDGGDVCEADERIFIGLSERTNAEGAAQLERWARSQGYGASIIDIRGMSSILHLKSGIAWLGDGRLLLIEELYQRPEFDGYERLCVAAGETYAANALRVNDHVLVARGFPRTEALLHAHGLSTIALDMSEFEKMDGGLSCLSLRY